MAIDRPDRPTGPADIGTPEIRVRLNTIAHDFNNLLTIVNGYAELLLKQLDEGDVKEQVFEIREAGVRAAELNDELLSIVRPPVADAEDGVLALPSRDAVSSSRKAACEAKEGAEQGGTETILLVDDQRELRRVSSGLLRRLGYEVLQAAGIDEATELAARTDGPIHLLITDIVLPASGGRELAARLTAQRPGLKVLYVSGYPLAHLVAQNKIEPDSPFLAKPFDIATLATAVRQALAVHSVRATVLVVDDEEGVRKLLSGVLSSAGYEVISASDGREAQQVLDTREVDLVVMDLVMPNREGIETISELHRARPDLKIVAISGFGGTFLTVATRLGARASLAKPINPDVLLRVVEETLAASS